jgi:DNA-directed RNA polymerase specialized sigma24 family protein
MPTSEDVMTTLTLEQDALTETWADCEALVNSLINKYAGQWTVDRDLILSECHLAFMDAYAGFDKEQGTSFKTWLYYKVQMRMREFRRTTAKQWNRTKDHVSTDAYDVAEEKTPLADTIDELTEDGRAIASLLFSPSPALKMELQGMRQNSPRRVRSVLSKFMQENYGWSLIRIRITFEEIRDALLP